MNLTDKVKPYVIDDLLILGFADKNYQEIAVNWVRYINKLDIINYVIIALDDEAFDYLNKHKINVV